MIRLGTFTAGEIPPALTVAMTDSTGNPVNLTGYTCKFVYTRHGGSETTRNATLSDGDDGEATYQWVEDDMLSAGSYTGRMWAGNGSNRFASDKIRWKVQAGGTVPDV